MATTAAAFPAARPAAAQAAPAVLSAPVTRRARAGFPRSGTALMLIFTVALIIGVVPIAAVIASPTWLMLGIALGTDLVLTLGILLTLLRFLEGQG